MRKVVLITQARMASTRLPGKVLRPILGRPMLSYQLERIRKVNRVNCMVVATTINDADDAIASFCEAEEVVCVRGSEHDVLSRYALAARESGADIVVRVTSDCPLLDPHLVDMLIEQYLEAEEVDYVSNMLAPTWPYGMAVEVFSSQVLFEAQAESSDPAEREHVTPFIYRRPERYKLQSCTRHPNLSNHRWTVDTPEDFELVRLILTELYPRMPDFHMEHVLDLLNKHQEWLLINQHIKQKTI